MSDDGKSFMDRRQEAEIPASQIQELAPNVKSVSFIERQEIHHHHHHAAAHKSGKEQFLEDLARDIAKGLEETFTIR